MQPGQASVRLPRPIPGLCSLAGHPTASWAESSTEPGLQPPVCSAAHEGSPDWVQFTHSSWSRRHWAPLEMRASKRCMQASPLCFAFEGDNLLFTGALAWESSEHHRLG